MSFCLRPNVCKKCGKPLTLFEGWTCLECEKAEQEPKSCEKCLYAEETDGSHCYECVKGESKFEQEPSDLIRRTDMLDAIGHGTTYTTEHLQKIINGLPSVNLKAECEDTISRQAVIDLVRECFPTEEQTTGWLMVEGIMALPSVQPKASEDTIQLLEQAIRDIKQAENRIKGGAE